RVDAAAVAPPANAPRARATTTEATPRPVPRVVGGVVGVQPLVAATGASSRSTAARHAVGMPARLTALRQRAAANTPQWTALKATCDSYIGGTVAYPTGNQYPDKPNLGSGYQGESYLPALLAEGMCYQVLKSSNAAAAAPYGAKAVDILMKMSMPYPGSNGWDPCTDSGYGIRFYGVGYGLGYDWVYDL